MHRRVMEECPTIATTISAQCYKKFKTMIDFYEGKLKCQGLSYKEIEGYLRHRFLWKEIKTFCVPAGADDRQELVNFLKL